MGHARRSLVLASAGGLACSALSTALAISQRLPAEFGGFLRGDDVARDFVTWKGTALSAPLPLLVAQGACTALALRSGSARRAGVAVLALLGAAQVVGQLGEPIVYRTMRPAAFLPVRAAAIAGNLAFSSLVAACGLRAWREDGRAQKSTTCRRLQGIRTDSAAGAARRLRAGRRDAGPPAQHVRAELARLLARVLDHHTSA